MKFIPCLAIVATASLLLPGAPALAEKPAWAGKQAQAAAASGPGFDSDSRRVISEYYATRKSKCPPGLAKKNNGCLPPGQAKKWSLGQALPADQRYASLPPELLKRLPPLPADQRYVRIAGDILLIAIGTRMVIDAVEDILR